MRQPFASLSFLLLAYGVASCGSSSSAPSPAGQNGADTGSDHDSASSADVGTADDTTPPADDTGSADPDTGSVGAAYPSGPYGRNAGQVLADLSMDGYLHVGPTGVSTEATFGTVSFSDIRSTATARYALIHEVGFF